MAALTARKQDQEIEIGELIQGSVADGIRKLALAAKLQGNWLRVFDIRYATAGTPTEITQEYVMFPPGSVEVLETGELSQPAQNTEVLGHERIVVINAVIQAEICKPNKDKK